MTYYSLDDYSLSTTFFFGATGFWSGDLAIGDLATGAFLVTGFFGASSSDSSDDDSTTFLAGLVAVLTGATTFFGALTYYSELSSLDYWAFFFGTTAFRTGDLALTTFFGASSSLSSEEDSCFLAFFEAPF